MSSESSDTDNGWNDEIESQIEQLGNLSLGYKWIYRETAKVYDSRHKKLSWASVVMPQIAGLTIILESFATQDPFTRSIFSISSIVLSFVSSILAAIIEFGDYGGKADENRRAAAKFTSLSGNIQRQISLYRTERENGMDYLGWITKNFEELQEMSPLLREDIIIKYTKAARVTGIVVPEAANTIMPMSTNIKHKAHKRLSVIQRSESIRRPPVLNLPRITTLGPIDEDTVGDFTRPSDVVIIEDVSVPPRVVERVDEKKKRRKDKNETSSEFDDNRMSYEMKRWRRHTGRIDNIRSPAVSETLGDGLNTPDIEDEL